MANTSAVYARIDTNLKENAEEILSRLGISPSGAIQMLYSQIILRKGIPFDVKLPAGVPVAAGSLTKEQLDRELQKGMDDMAAGRVIPAHEVEAEMRSLYGE